MCWKMTEGIESKYTQADKYQELEDFKTRSEVKLLHFPNFSQIFQTHMLFTGKVS